MMIRRRLLSVRILLVSAAAWLSAQDTELNTLLFQTTFKVEGRRAVFRDGTVLSLAEGVTSPVTGALVRAEIDPGRHEVRALVLP